MKHKCFTVFTNSLKLVSWVIEIHTTATSHMYSRYILILSSHLCLHLPRGLHSSWFPTKLFHSSFISNIHVTFYPLIWSFYKYLVMSMNYETTHYAISSPSSCFIFLSPNILHHLFWNFLVLSSPRMTYEDSNPQYIWQEINQRTNDAAITLTLHCIIS